MSIAERTPGGGTTMMTGTKIERKAMGNKAAFCTARGTHTLLMSNAKKEKIARNP